MNMLLGGLGGKNKGEKAESGPTQKRKKAGYTIPGYRKNSRGVNSRVVDLDALDTPETQHLMGATMRLVMPVASDEREAWWQSNVRAKAKKVNAVLGERAGLDPSKVIFSKKKR